MNPELAIAAVTHVLKSMLTDGLGDLNINAAFGSAAAGVPSLSQAHIKHSWGLVSDQRPTIVSCLVLK